MDDIYKLLNIEPEFHIRFPSLAKKVVDHRTEEVIYESIDRLRMIDEELFIDAIRNIPQQSIDIVLDKVILEARTHGSLGTWSNKELRILSYYLSSLHEDERAFNYALRVMDASWKNFIFNGLVNYLLSNWLSSEKEYLKKVRALLTRRLQNYDLSNSRYLKLKENIGFWEDESGAIRMATLLSIKEMDLAESPRLLGFSPSIFSLPYFSEVILKYIVIKKLIDLNTVGIILQKHNLDRTRKLALAYLIFAADENGDDFRQQEVARFARGILGDISLASSWSPFTDASAEEVASLRRAKDIVVQWNNRNVIKVFFEKCVRDPARKYFWLKRASSVVDFRIAGTDWEKYKLEKDERTADLVSRYFITTAYKQDTALILCIKDKVFIEFSNVGSVYVYNHGNPCLDIISSGRKSILKTDVLKVKQSNIVTKEGGYYYFYEEGRMVHRGNWEYRLDFWFRKILDNRELPNIGFTPNNDDEVFVVKEKEPTIRYVDNIRYMLASKDVPIKRGCHVVVNKQGYYVYLPRGMRYAFIKPLPEGVTPNGAILIRTHEEGWYKVVHVYIKKEIEVFYMKIIKNNLLYKLKADQENSLMVRL